MYPLSFLSITTNIPIYQCKLYQPCHSLPDLQPEVSEVRGGSYGRTLDARPVLSGQPTAVRHGGREGCDDGSNVQFWAFRKFVICKEEGKQTSHSASGSRKLSGNDLAALKTAFKSLNWSFDVYSNDEVIGKDGWSSNAATLLEQAGSALEKLSKEAGAS